MKVGHRKLVTIRVGVQIFAAWVAAGGALAADAPKGLVLHLTFDKQEGAVVADASGQKNTGQAMGAKWSASGKKGGAYEFAGNNLIQVNNSPSLNMRQGTFAAWFKTSKADAVWRRLLDKRAFTLCISGDAASCGKLAIGINGRAWAFSDGTVTDGSWHHAAATFDGANIKLFVDGQLQKQVAALRGEIAPNTSPLVIGQAFQGALDEVMVFNRALSEEEVKGLLSAGGSEVAGKAPGKTFTKEQVARRLRELKDLLDKGLITQSFYERKVEECKTTE